MKKAVIRLMLFIAVAVLSGCSNVLTYVRHDETSGNIQCNGEKGLKRDSVCNISPAAKK